MREQTHSQHSLPTSREGSAGEGTHQQTFPPYRRPAREQAHTQTIAFCAPGTVQNNPILRLTTIVVCCAADVAANYRQSRRMRSKVGATFSH